MIHILLWDCSQFPALPSVSLIMRWSAAHTVEEKNSSMLWGQGHSNCFSWGPFCKTSRGQGSTLHTVFVTLAWQIKRSSFFFGLNKGVTLFWGLRSRHRESVFECPTLTFLHTGEFLPQFIVEMSNFIKNNKMCGHFNVLSVNEIYGFKMCVRWQKRQINLSSFHLIPCF